MASLPIITAFANSPDKGRGLARDTIVRWAFEEVGQPYDVRLISFKELKAPGHMALHPFGKIPTFESNGAVLFETGAIVLHIAETYAGLFPLDSNRRLRVISWMFAALSTVEPVIVEYEAARLTERDQSWYEERVPILEARIRQRLGELSTHLADAEWLEGDFSAGDVLMVSALRRLGQRLVITEFPNLMSYVQRGEARPAFQRAFAAQLAVFNAL